MKTRIISAVVAILIFIPLLIVGGIPFSMAVGILSVLAYKEIIDLKRIKGKVPNVVKLFGLISVIYLVLGNYGMFNLNYAVSYSRLLLPLVLVLLPTVFCDNKYKTDDAIYLLGFIYLIGIFFNLVIVLRNINVYLLVYLLSVSIFTDTFAYIIGMLIGKHKMSPKISPKKSIEGAIGGLIGGGIISALIYYNLIDATFSVKLVMITMLLSFIGQIGDLFYSKIKRENDIKDFSNIMPGHGGVLDRLDSLSFVVIFYVLLVWFI